MYCKQELHGPTAIVFSEKERAERERATEREREEEEEEEVEEEEGRGRRWGKERAHASATLFHGFHFCWRASKYADAVLPFIFIFDQVWTTLVWRQLWRPRQ